MIRERSKRKQEHYTQLLFSKDLRWFLWHGPARGLMAEQEGTWRAGLCWILAEGLLLWVNFSRIVPIYAASLIVIGDAKCPAHHVAVCLYIKANIRSARCWYLDANGVSTKATLLRYWQDEEGLVSPFLASYNEQLLLDLGIPHHRQMSMRLAERFKETFGWFSLTFLDE